MTTKREDPRSRKGMTGFPSYDGIAGLGEVLLLILKISRSPAMTPRKRCPLASFVMSSRASSKNLIAKDESKRDPRSRKGLGPSYDGIAGLGGV